MSILYDKLKSVGYHESLESVIERWYNSYVRCKNKERKKVLFNKINEVCSANKIGNPIDGQPIISEREYVSKCGQKTSQK